MRAQTYTVIDQTSGIHSHHSTIESAQEAQSTLIEKRVSAKSAANKDENEVYAEAVSRFSIRITTKYN